jgi:antagonist of KipI
MATFEVLKPGTFTTIQDLGRYGYQKYGLAVSGSVDSYSHRMANLLAGNQEKAAVLEVTLVGLKLKVLKPTVIAVAGGDMQLKLNEKLVANWSSTKVQEGDILQFSGVRSGCRSYLATAGGFDVPYVLGSRSTDTLAGIGGLEGRALQKGDLLYARDLASSKLKLPRRRLHPTFIPDYPDNVDVRVILGPQADSFTEKGIETFLSSTYTVSKDLDRMGCRLEGETIEHKSGADIISEGIFMGAIQVPKNGLPIVFLVGRRSVGGYTKIGGVIAVDMMKLAQVKQGNKIRFHEIDIEEAHQLHSGLESVFQSMKGHIVHK